MSTSYSLFKNLVLLFVSPFALSSSGAISFVFKWLSAFLLSATLFVLATSLIVLLNEIIVRFSANQHPVILSC